YTSEHLSLAVLETLVQVTRDELPDLVAHEIEIDDRDVENLSEAAIRRVRRARWSRAVSRAIGDAWLAGGRSLAFRVPSAIVARESNVVINPEHAGASGLEIISSEPFRFDPRLAA
ncbi:MAG: RES family NAD+ phosphorylase, partial [Gemmatimonadota bacterium]